MIARRKMKNVALGFVAGAAAVLGLIGLAHTKYGRPLLRHLPGASACPMMAGAKLTAAERQARRDAALERVLGTERAASRPALGFTLGASTKADVMAGMRDRGVACTEREEGLKMACPSATGDVEATFDLRGVLVGIDIARRDLDAAAALRLLSEREAEISRAAGPAYRKDHAAAADLEPGSIARAGVEFRFSDYRASISATRMGALGLLVREEYQAPSSID